ncbi:MAG: hypothetical protein UHI81_09150 [Olegusella sp.]|nr:hypothetical protein [Olegusella sp.]
MRVKGWEHENVTFRLQDFRETTWSTDYEDGETYFTIRTYGPNGGSAKQIVQFDRERAIELIEILKKEFSI